MDSPNSLLVVADPSPAPLSPEEITDLDAHELAQFGLLTSDVVVRRLRGRDHTTLLRGTRVTSRKSLIETMKMRNLKTKLPTYRIGFWEFAFGKTFIMFAKSVDDLNDHVVLQEMMEVCWVQMLNILYKKWTDSRLSQRMKEEKLTAARVQANLIANKKARKYWEKKAKKVWKSHGVRLPINDGYNIEGFSNLSQVNRKGKSYETVDEDTLFGFQDIVPSHEMQTSEEELREQRELLGNPEVDMERIARIAQQELAKATQQLVSFRVDEQDGDDPNTSDDDGSIAEEVFKTKEIKAADDSGEEEFEGDNEESSDAETGDIFEEEHDGNEDLSQTSTVDGDIEEFDEGGEDFDGFSEKDASFDDNDGTDTSDGSDEGLMVITSALPPGTEPEYDTWKGSDEDDADGESSDNETSDEDSEDEITSFPNKNPISIPNNTISTSNTSRPTRPTRPTPRTITSTQSTLNAAHQIHRTIRVPANTLPNLNRTNFTMFSSKRKRQPEDYDDGENSAERKKRG